jgi:hypothetical protein
LVLKLFGFAFFGLFAFLLFVLIYGFVFRLFAFGQI